MRCVISGRAPWWSVVSRLGPLRATLVAFRGVTLSSGLVSGQMSAAQGHIADPRPDITREDYSRMES